MGFLHRARSSPFPIESGRVTMSPDRSERGDTLIEILLALVVLGLASISLIIAFSTSISASAEHRRLATANIILGSASQQIVAGVSSQLSLFTSCAGSPSNYTAYQAAAPITIPAPYNAAPTLYTATISNVQWWNVNTASFSNALCIQGVPQELSLIHI